MDRAAIERGEKAAGADLLVERLARASIGATFNQYRRSRLRRERLIAYLEARRDAPVLVVGEAAGYRGARVSGVPFTSERQLSGSGPAEASATIVHRVLAELDLEDRVLLWNVVPTHPHLPGRPDSNRRPTCGEVAASLPFLEEFAGPPRDRGRPARAGGARRRVVHPPPGARRGGSVPGRPR